AFPRLRRLSPPLPFPRARRHGAAGRQSRARGRSEGRLKAFDYAAPATLEEATALLREDGAAALAGGTQLLLTFKWLPPPRLVVNLKRLPGLRGVKLEGDETWIGALTTLADVRRSPELAE